MAASAKNVGAWAASNATTQVVTLPAHAAGDMLFVVAACKPYTAAPTITNPATGWTRLYTYADGTVANGNGTGSVRQVLFYREAASAAETNPTVSWGTTSAPGIAVAGVLQKDAGDTWNTPLATNGNTNAATGISVSLADPGIAAGGIGLVVHTTRDNSALTVPNWTQTSATLGTLTEWPATAISSATSNDMAGDMAYRTVTTPGTGNITATGTQGAAETGVTSIVFFGVTAAAVGYYSDEVLADVPTHYYTSDDASGNLTDSSGNGHTATAAGTPGYGQTGPMTNALAVDVTSGDFSAPDHADNDLGDGPYTLELWFKRTAATSAGYLLGKTDSSFATPGYAIELREGATDTVRLQNGATSTHVNNTAQLFNDTAWHHAAFVRAAATTAVLYIDKVAVAISSSAMTFSDNALALVIGALYSGLGNFDGLMSRVAIYKSALSAARIAAHYDAAVTNGEAAAGTTVTPGTASLSLTAFAPTVTATANQTVTPGVASLTLTAQTPTVTASDHKAVTPGVASLSLTPLAPTGPASDNPVATPATAALALAAFAPTVAVSDNVTVTPGVAPLALSGLAPVVAASDHQVVTPDTAALALAPLAPSVILGTFATPDPAALGLTAFAPAVTASDHKVVTPDPATLALTAFAPVVTGGAGLTVTPDPAALALTAFAPDVAATYHVTVTPAPATLGLTAFAPEALASDHKTVTPLTASLTLGLFAPTVLTPVIATPGVLALILTAFAPGVLVLDHRLVTPGTASLSLTAFAPSVIATDNVGGGLIELVSTPACSCDVRAMAATPTVASRRTMASTRAMRGRGS